MRILFLAGLLTVATVTTHELAGSPPTDAPSETTTQGDQRVSDSQTTPEDSVSTGEPEQATSSFLNLNLPFKTAGGTQFWTDRIWREGYRIQHNSLTGHFRLVDAKNVRRAWGGRAHCDAALDRLHPTPKRSDAPKRVVVLIHGLMRTHHSMKPMEKSLRTAGNQHVIRFAYASARSSIGDHASALREVLEDFPDDTEFCFVGHSMGNIVVRRMIGDLQRDDDPGGILTRCESMVMLGPPNQGAAIARKLASTGLFGFVTGKGGMELGPEWKTFVKKLSTPHFPFVIIAGDLSDNSVQNPLIDGSSDFVVSVDEAKLEGAESFHTVPVVHSFLMSDDSAVELTIDFINSHRDDSEKPE